MKYFVPLLIVLIIGGGAVLLMASGNYGPKADAEAQKMQAQTRTQEARDAIDAKTYARKQELELQVQEQLDGLQVEQQKRLNEQEFEQRQDAYARWQLLLEAGMWIVTAGAALALVIAASALAYKLFEQARALRQEAKWAAEARTLQSQILKLERQLEKQQTAMYALEQAQTASKRDMEERLAQTETKLKVLQRRWLEYSVTRKPSLTNDARGRARDFPEAA